MWVLAFALFLPAHAFHESNGLPVTYSRPLTTTSAAFHTKPPPSKTPQSKDPSSEYFDILDEGLNEWRFAFRGSARVGVPVYGAYMTGAGISEPVPEVCKQANWSRPCNSHYRNNDVLNNWQNIQDVLFGIVKDGVMVKHMLFNGTDTDFVSWFSKEKYLNGGYADLQKTYTDYFSMAGNYRQNEVERRFFINNVNGSCPGDIGWVVAIDNVQSQRDCDWEKVQSPGKDAIPTIIYNPGQKRENWNSQYPKYADAFVVFVRYRHYRGNMDEYFDVFGTGKKEYRLVFRGTAGAGTEVYPAYKDGTGIPSQVNAACKQLDFTRPCTTHYRNDDALGKWTHIEEVIFLIIYEDAAVGSLRFSGVATNYMSWFSQKYLRDAFWHDTLSKGPGTFSYFSMEGHGVDYSSRRVRRRFFINPSYNSCATDHGWFVAVDNTDSVCSWESSTTIPKILFSGDPRVRNWNTPAIKEAQAFVILVKYAM